MRPVYWKDRTVSDIADYVNFRALMRTIPLLSRP